MTPPLRAVVLPVYNEGEAIAVEAGRGSGQRGDESPQIASDELPNSRADLPVVILAGGLGTRLREEKACHPEPMVEVGGRPILWHIMKTYDHVGFRCFVFPIGYLVVGGDLTVSWIAVVGGSGGSDSHEQGREAS